MKIKNTVKKIAIQTAPYLAGAAIVTAAGALAYYLGHHQKESETTLDVRPVDLARMALQGGRIVFDDVLGLKLALTIIDE